MRALILGLLVVSFLSATTFAHADPLDPKILDSKVLDLKREARHGKILASVGIAALGASSALSFACAILSFAQYGAPGIGDRTAGIDVARVKAEIITTCSLHGALLAVGLPLTIGGSSQARKAHLQLRVGLTGLSGTF